MFSKTLASLIGATLALAPLVHSQTHESSPNNVLCCLSYTTVGGLGQSFFDMFSIPYTITDPSVTAAGGCSVFSSTTCTPTVTGAGSCPSVAACCNSVYSGFAGGEGGVLGVNCTRIH